MVFVVAGIEHSYEGLVVPGVAAHTAHIACVYPGS